MKNAATNNNQYGFPGNISYQFSLPIVSDNPPSFNDTSQPLGRLYVWKGTDVYSYLGAVQGLSNWSSYASELTVSTFETNTGSVTPNNNELYLNVGSNDIQLINSENKIRVFQSGVINGKATMSILSTNFVIATYQLQNLNSTVTMDIRCALLDTGTNGVGEIFITYGISNYDGNGYSIQGYNKYVNNLYPNLDAGTDLVVTFDGPTIIVSGSPPNNEAVVSFNVSGTVNEVN